MLTVNDLKISRAVLLIVMVIIGIFVVTPVYAVVTMANVDDYFQRFELDDYRVTDTEVSDNPVCQVNTETVIKLPEEVLEAYVLAGVRDELTVVRLFIELARRVNARGVSLCGEGDAINRIIDRNRINLGLSLPMRSLGYYAWQPHESEDKSEAVVKLTLVYRESYVHSFAKEILPADVKIGTGEEIQFKQAGIDNIGKLVSMDVFFSEKRFGFRNISGVA